MDDDDLLIAPNGTNSTLLSDRCQDESRHMAMFILLDLLSLGAGQPLSARLLWISLTSRPPDILNFNLALFHTLLYCFLYCHLFVIFLFHHILGQLHKFIFVYVQVGGPLQLSFTCLERFIAVVRPTYFPLLRKYKCREICAVLVWMTTLPLAVLYVIPDEKRESRQEIIERLPLFLMVMLGCIIVSTSFKVAKILRNPPAGKDSLHPAKKRAFVTISVTSAVAMSCYVPVMVVSGLKSVPETMYSCALIPLCIFFLSLASLVHPLFYLYAKGEFNCKRRSKKPS